MPTPHQKRNRRRLIEALRSGKFSQAKGYLRTPTGFCCQGVACHLFRDQVQGRWEFNREENDLGNFVGFKIPGVDRDDHSYVTEWHEDIRDLLGFTGVETAELARMNDGALTAPRDPMNSYTFAESCTFAEIADCMELLTFAGL